MSSRCFALRLRRALHAPAVLLALLLGAAPALADARKSTDAPLAPGGSEQPLFEESGCWFRMPRDREMTCGWLNVPENRGKADSNRIRLAVAIFEPDRERYDPIVYLTGGPGQPAYIETLADIETWWSFADREPWLRGRRLIVLDQRGTGISQPKLDCPGLYDPTSWSGVVPTPDYHPDITASQQRGLETCRDRLLAAGIDLAAYNTRESAADIADLRRALDIDRWVLFGISYGTRLALTVLRDHPEGVTAAVLDSVLPLEVDYIGESAATFEEALKRLFADCRADYACDSSFGDLQPLLTESVRRFAAAPLPLRLTEATEAPRFLHFDGNDYLWLIFSALYDWDRIERLPMLIRDTAAQDYRHLAEQARLSYLDSADSDFAEGMQFSVGCHEEFPFYGAAPLPRTFALLDGWVEGDFFLWACPLWPSGKAGAAENEPVVSEVPALLLSGDYDPITPATWARRALSGLPRGHHLVFRGIGHDVVDSTDCGGQAVADFLANPAKRPATPCVAEMEPPYFILDARDW
jgi:pimeloyl-ACP methyl ester carboxylesterase